MSSFSNWLKTEPKEFNKLSPVLQSEIFTAYLKSKSNI